MKRSIFYNSFQLREIFHLEFLRWFGRKINMKFFAVKGGANLRFFFQSRRYSEDLDLDITGVQAHHLKDTVMKIFQTPAFQNNFPAFGIEKIGLPDISKAKQTETTQRFKIHLITSAREDLFSEIKFSRRGMKGTVEPQFVSESILREYGMPPLLVPHYDLLSTISQKIEALAARFEVQARDIFDVHVLSSQYGGDPRRIPVSDAKLSKAKERFSEVGFPQFRDTVLAYLTSEDRVNYDSPLLWDEIKLKVAQFFEKIRKENV